MKKLGAVVTVGAVLALTGCAGSDSRLADANHDCAVASTAYSGLSLEDEGKTLVFDMKGKEETTGGDVDELACVLNKLKAPSRVITLMDSTRSLDGKQTETWDGITATWRYHPDAGLDLVFYYEND